jgi:hypothetical protein
MGALLRWILSPATALFMRSRNVFKLPMIAAVFTLALALALFYRGWGATALALGAWVRRST